MSLENNNDKFNNYITNNNDIDNGTKSDIVSESFGINLGYGTAISSNDDREKKVVQQEWAVPIEPPKPQGKGIGITVIAKKPRNIKNKTNTQNITNDGSNHSYNAMANQGKTIIQTTDNETSPPIVGAREQSQVVSNSQFDFIIDQTEVNRVSFEREIIQKEIDAELEKNAMNNMSDKSNINRFELDEINSLFEVDMKGQTIVSEMVEIDDSQENNLEFTELNNAKPIENNSFVNLQYVPIVETKKEKKAKKAQIKKQINSSGYKFASNEKVYSSYYLGKTNKSSRIDVTNKRLVCVDDGITSIDIDRVTGVNARYSQSMNYLKISILIILLTGATILTLFGMGKVFKGVNAMKLWQSVICYVGSGIIALVALLFVKGLFMKSFYMVFTVMDEGSFMECVSNKEFGSFKKSSIISVSVNKKCKKLIAEIGADIIDVKENNKLLKPRL